MYIASGPSTTLNPQINTKQVDAYWSVMASDLETSGTGKGDHLLKRVGLDFTLKRKVTFSTRPAEGSMCVSAINWSKTREGLLAHERPKTQTTYSSARPN